MAKSVQDQIGPVEFRDRWELVLDHLRHLIYAGSLTPGARLSENELAAQFGVSRGPIREALRALEVEGLVQRQRLATFVTSFTRQDVDEIYSLRKQTDELAVRIALRDAREGLVERLSADVDAMQRALREDRRTDLPTADIDFHSAFYELSGHGRLLVIWNNTLRGPLRVLMRITGLHADPDTDATMHGHTLILEAVREGDAKACVRRAHEHLDQGREILLRHLDEAT